MLLTTVLAGGLGLVLMAVFLSGYFAGPVSPLLKYVPEDVDVVALWRMPELLKSSDALEDFGGFEVRAWEMPYELYAGELRVGSLVLDSWLVSEYMMAVDLDSDMGVSLVLGDFVFEHLRDDLSYLGFVEDSYRGYEVWSGLEHYAFLPHPGIILASADEIWLRQVLNLLHRRADMLPDSDGHGLNLVLERLREGAFLFASVDRDTQWGCPVRRCQGYGVALTGYDVAELEATAEFVVLFSSERSAQVAADEYDELLRFAESVADNGFFDYRGRVIVVDAVADGKFVDGEAVVSP